MRGGQRERHEQPTDALAGEHGRSVKRIGEAWGAGDSAGDECLDGQKVSW
jgi:hypothetical protein